MSRCRIGLVGARGYVGEELIKLIAAHPQMELGFVSSRERGGERVGEQGRRCERVQDFRKLGVHPRALSGSKNDDGDGHGASGLLSGRGRF